MTTPAAPTDDLEARLTAALVRRSAALAVDHPEAATFGDTGAQPGRRRARLVLVAAALVLVAALGGVTVIVLTGDDPQSVDTGPADDPDPTTTKTKTTDPRVPPFAVTHLPDELDGPPAYSRTSPSGSVAAQGWGTGPGPWVAVVLARGIRPAAVQAALDARDGPALLAARGLPAPEGGLGLTSDAHAALEDYLVTLQSRPAPPPRAEPRAWTELVDGRLVIVHGVHTSTSSGTVSTAAVAFPGTDLELTVHSEGLNQAQILAVLAGVEIDGVAAEPTPPPAGPATTAPAAPGKPPPAFGVQGLPEGWVLRDSDELETGAVVQAVFKTFVPADADPADMTDFRRITVNLSRQPLTAEERAAADSGEEAALLEAFAWFATEAAPARSTGLRVEEVDGRPVLVAGSTLAARDLDIDLDVVRTSVRVLAVLGPDLIVQVSAEEVTEEEVLAVLAGVELLPA